MIITVVFFYAVLINSVQGDLPISIDDYKALPVIYNLDADEKCYENGKFYCTLKAVLEPNDLTKPSRTWKNIQKLNKLPNFFNRHELFHGICFDDYCKESRRNHSTDFYEALKQCYTNKYQDLDLKANIVRHNCKNMNESYKANITDVLLLIILICYIAFIIYATFYEYLLNKTNRNKTRITEGNIYILSFSVIKNWNGIKRASQTSNTKTLSYIQGMRYYNTIFIIIFHTILGYFLTYSDNPNYIEEADNNPVKYILKNSFVFLVQPFFLLSGFFLSYNTFEKLGHLETLSIKHLSVLLLNRYLRLIPSLLIALILSSTIWFGEFTFTGPLNEMFCKPELNNCQKNWWTNLLFINNIYDTTNICYLISWYLSADFQLYAFSLIILAVIWKYKSHVKLILFIPFISGIIIRAFTNYMYEFQVIYRVYPDRIKDNAFRDNEMAHNYMFTYLHLPTYIIGIYIGYIFYEYKNRRIFHTTIMKSLFWIGSFGLPATALLLTTGHNYSKVMTAFIASILYPIFSLGIGIFILGMRENLSQFLKNILENKVATILASFSYSTYINQYNIMLQETCSQINLAFISDVIIAISSLRNIILSFLLGFVVYIMVELPAFSIQKMLVPQIEDIKDMKKEHVQ